MKIFNLFLAALFVVFAAVQFNDPDPWGWAAMYFFVAGICAFAAFGRYHRWGLLGGLAIVLIWAATLAPDFIHWTQMGAPTITGQMKATEPHIELTREFLGLLICGAVLLFQYVRMRRAEN